MSAARGRRVSAVALAVAAAALVALYLGLTSAQPNAGSALTQIFAVLFAVLGALPVVALALPDPVAPLLTGLSASAWAVLAVLTAFSLGPAVIPVALIGLACLGFTLAGSARRRLPPALAGAFLGLLLPLALVRAEPYLPPSCPSARGNLSGEAAYPGPLYGDVTVTYSCRDGRLLEWRVSKGVRASGSGSGTPSR